LKEQIRTIHVRRGGDSPADFAQEEATQGCKYMNATFVSRRKDAFSFVEVIFTIAIIGIMSSLVVSAISNVSRDANRVLARQQQASVQSALTSWVMAQTRVGSTAQMRSLEDVRTTYNALGTSSARFNLLVPNASSPDPGIRAGFLDQTTADHFLDYTTGTDKLKTAALENVKQYLSLPTWQSGDFPRVDLVNE
jgi:prepilin-type N-terminal cleavage/methylation domain-containing protein